MAAPETGNDPQNGSAEPDETPARRFESYRSGVGTERPPGLRESNFDFADWAKCRVLAFGCSAAEVPNFRNEVKKGVRIARLVIESEIPKIPVLVMYSGLVFTQSNIVAGLCTATEERPNLIGRIVASGTWTDDKGEERPRYRWRPGVPADVAWGHKVMEDYGIGSPAYPTDIEGIVDLTTDDGPSAMTEEQREAYCAASGREYTARGETSF